MTSGLLSGVRIAEVYAALTGIEPRKTGATTWRAPATWRGGDGLSVSLDDARGAWYDFVAGDGGGILDLIVTVRDGTRQDALRWLAGHLGIELDTKVLSPEDRARYAEEFHAAERDREPARLWRRAVLDMADDLVEAAKASLFGPVVEDEIPVTELPGRYRLHCFLQGLQGAALLHEYRWWAATYPGLTAGMCRAAKAREQASQRALLRYLRATEKSAA